jgi:hypothetical protein
LATEIDRLGTLYHLYEYCDSPTKKKLERHLPFYTKHDFQSQEEE